MTITFRLGSLTAKEAVMQCLADTAELCENRKAVSYGRAMAQRSQREARFYEGQAKALQDLAETLRTIEIE